MKLTDKIFNATEVTEVKTELKFSNMYFKCKPFISYHLLIVAENTKQSSKSNEINEKISQTSTHIDTLQKRMKRISQTVDDIIHH